MWICFHRQWKRTLPTIKAAFGHHLMTVELHKFYVNFCP
jgi:hypothetical protein